MDTTGDRPTAGSGDLVCCMARAEVRCVVGALGVRGLGNWGWGFGVGDLEVKVRREGGRRRE
jgi:hypothetical protein